MEIKTDAWDFHGIIVTTATITSPASKNCNLPQPISQNLPIQSPAGVFILIIAIKKSFGWLDSFDPAFCIGYLHNRNKKIVKYMPVLFIMSVIFSCKKEGLTVLPLPAGASNIIEGDIVWGGINSTHFKNQTAVPTSVYTFFDLDTAYKANSNYQIRMTGYDKDTIIEFQILNPNLNTPGIYNFQDLDSNHFVAAHLQSGFSLGGSPPQIGYDGISYSNKGWLTIDTISENHISGSIDTYCNRENLIANIPDTNEVHLLFHFSGDLRRD